MYVYLTMKVGSRAGLSFMLTPGAETTIGRDDECGIAVADPLASRVHAAISQRDGRWRVCDLDSRNGTFVNDRKVDEAVLGEGNFLRVGATEFSFHQSDVPPTVAFSNSNEMLQEVVRDTMMDRDGTAAHALAAIGDSAQTHDLLLLYQLSIKLLGCGDPLEVVRISLELLRDHTRASVVGFLWVDEQGELRPKMAIPEQAPEQIPFSQALTRLVSQEGHAVWIANQQKQDRSAQLQHYADALCVPLLSRGEVLGAIHAYLDHGHFRQSQFDFAISLANITAVALVRARHTENLQTRLSRMTEQAGGDEIVGSSPPMKELKSRIMRVAATTGCVLIRGESGVGKELVARAVHRASPRADRPLLSVNCAAIPHDLMESQLFGHKAGAFTGADRDHAGYFQQADLGTLFLDEIGELTLPGQAKLLRILEGHPFLPVGATQEAKVDVRVIAATNQDLQTYVRDKRFRADLYYRLSVFELNVPALRERGEDIGRLIDFFLDTFRRQHGRPELQLADDARRMLLSYHWPGNVRQLRNVIDSAVVLAVGRQIEASDLGLRDAGEGELETLRFDYWERRLIDEALRRTGGNVPEAAKLLGIGRATLYRKLEEYGIQR